MFRQRFLETRVRSPNDLHYTKVVSTGTFFSRQPFETRGEKEERQGEAETVYSNSISSECPGKLGEVGTATAWLAVAFVHG